MAYKVQYQISYKNEQEDIYRIDILGKDFTGNITTLLGAARPFVQKYSIDERPPNPIIASEAEVNFWSDDLVNLESFYSEDDEQFRVDHYCETANGVGINKLLWSGYLVQDDCREEFQDPPYVITLNFTDNLALLKNVTFEEAFTKAAIEDLVLIDKINLWNIIRICLINTGISLPFSVYSNIYENGTLDRGDINVATMFEQTYVFTGKWLSEDGGWAKCYDILQDILFPLNATLIQADGKWNIIRYPEAYLFTGNAIPGTQWDETFSSPQAVTLDPNFTVNIGQPGFVIDHQFLGADAIKTISRPFKFINYTFNYEQPKSLIKYNDLQTLGAFISTSTDGSLRYDDYELPEGWIHKYDDASFIRVVTDTTSNTEVERYIYQPKIGNAFKYVRFNPIEVSAGDVIDFSLSFRHISNTTDNDRFTTRFILVTTDGHYYVLTRFPASGSSVNVHWNGPFDISVVDTATTVPMDYSGDSDDSQYLTFSLSSFVEDGGVLPRLPTDGMLLIDIGGSNETNLSLPDIDIVWKDINLTITNRINDSTDIIGQTHTQTQTANIKNVYDEEIKNDDSPRNTIAGTYFIPAITNFGADIGSIRFTRTSAWHRSNIGEAKRLGEITTFERKFLSYKSRTIIEGTFTRIRYIKDDEIRFVSPLTFILIEALSGLNFIIGQCEIDYDQSTLQGTLWELYSDSDSEEAFSSSYQFKYLYKTN